MRRTRAVLGTLLLLAVLVAACGLWWWAQQRQYALNRALIAALVKGDNRQALALVNAGANPNTQHIPSSATGPLSLRQLWDQLLHRSSVSSNDSPTAFMIACGDCWDVDEATCEAQRHAPDPTQLLKAMLKHGANVNVVAQSGETPLMITMFIHNYDRMDIIDILLQKGANVNAQNEAGLTALHYAVEHRVDIDFIRKLLVHGADPNRFSASRGTVLDDAQQQFNDPEVVTLLRQYGAKNSKKRL